MRKEQESQLEQLKMKCLQIHNQSLKMDKIHLELEKKGKTSVIEELKYNFLTFDAIVKKFM